MTNTTVPIILCGKSTQIGTSVIAALKPEYEVIHFILTPAAALAEIPLILKGEAVTSDNDLGSHDYSKKTRVVIFGGAYEENDVEAVLKASKEAGGPLVPFLRPDTTKAAPPLGPEYGKALVARLKVTMGEMNAEGKLGAGNEDLYLSNLIRHQSPPNPIKTRLPPTFEIPGKTWEPTPYNWFLGTWYFTHSNSVVYQLWQDMQWTLSATGTTDIDGTLQDLTSEFALNETAFVFKNYGIDTPTVINGQIIPDSYTYVPTAPLSFANNTWEVLAWGYDSNGVPYAAVYETPADAGFTGPSLDIISRDDNGPSKPTLDGIYDAIKYLKNSQLDALLSSVVKLPQNGARDGQPYPSCNATCMMNAYAFGVALGTGEN
ncbi:hypothetical protein G7Y89_g7440 [Cudoniella acicularis]|uniref:Uncharacterized protein n=1 Tax=Cudoniella acicularis TaxID=354080 RepID=A0A8H4W3T9_9HELO|nr:hypothetical protein G7Y89_g7440 [Cudoniella acicularis]